MSSPTPSAFALLMRPESLPARFSFAEEPLPVDAERRGPAQALRLVRRAVTALRVTPPRAGLMA